MIRFPPGKKFDLSSGTIKPIEISTKTANELVGRRVWVSGWGITENIGWLQMMTGQGQYADDLRIVEMELDADKPPRIWTSGPMSPERALISSSLNPFNKAENGDMKGSGSGDSGGNYMNITYLMPIF